MVVGALHQQGAILQPHHSGVGGQPVRAELGAPEVVGEGARRQLGRGRGGGGEGTLLMSFPPVLWLLNRYCCLTLETRMLPVVE